ncbi:hypothetical protein DFH07DRAFT_843337 [Mycena maculata]|uniref:F-box domain-containing protein n=1 Tax=Mycena maculata TaxID=230809 RepID=A0AAD7MY34_9AGAR|nr:hypothetical protein DFH07DRAFT_843337 [Mycena maculata]
MANKRSARASKRLKATSEDAALDNAATPTPADNTLTGMPSDILRQILQIMSPAELLAMHDVNKGFRRMLAKSGKKENPIWVNSREHHGIPKPFEGFDELAWARFIFGRICEECEKNESDAPDFGLMMRLCTKCREANLCQELDFSEESDGEDIMGPILEFEDSFPHSNWYSSREEIFEEGYGRGRFARTQTWWAPYLWDILPLVRGARRGVRGAQKKLDKLFEEGERRLKHGELCDEWRDRLEAEENRVKQESLKNKFKALGYQDSELDGVDSHKVLVQFKHPLTEDAWAVMRESLEGPIRDKRRSRLLTEHPDMMKARQILAREAYLAYAVTVLPREATFLPTLAGLEDIPEIRSICECEPDVEVTIVNFSALPSIIEGWVTAKRVRLTQLANGAMPEKTADRFNLASTIFRCHNGHEKLGRPAMFGGDEAMRHVGEKCDPQLDQALSEVAFALVTSLGLDPSTASVADMDQHNPRFRCDGRVAYNVCGKSNKDIEVFTWRGCITHAIETHHYGSQEKMPSYRKLDANYYHKDGTVSFVVISAHPGAESRGPFNDDLPRANSTSWVCGHCTKFVCAPETFQAVNDHVKTEHGEPHPGTSDVLLAPSVLPVSRSCYSIGRLGSTVRIPKLTAPGAFVCLRCLKKSKLFRTSGAVCDHLRGVHSIHNAVLDLDYGMSTS